MDVKFDVNEALQKVAEGLGVAVDKVYPILYKQSIITGITNLIWVALIATFIVLFLKYIRHASKKVTEGIRNSPSIIRADWSDYPVEILIIFTGSVASIIFVILGSTLISESITALFNTEYHMIEQVLTYVR